MKNARGFTLIEMAVAIFIIALLLGSLLIPLTTQVEQKQTSDTLRTLEEVKEALIGHAVANGHLPCPDTDNDGIENVDAGSGQCSTINSGISAGNLPWSTLGLASADVWGNRLRLVINERYARRAPATPFGLAAVGTDVRVCTTMVPSCATTLSTTAIAAVLSLGKNGYGATNAIGGVNTAPTGPDEQENVDGDRDVVSRVHTAADAAAGEFDDIVTWLSRYILVNRMVMANRLP
jgi:prepilin-type N-terminal cleavage/methylation domain-containing protein